MERYDHSAIESKWQKLWQDQGTFAADDKTRGEHAYVLDMFPYPSAQGLHVGHPEGYTATDIYCRYLRMKGMSVLHPMGWDAFGLPAENYAIKTGRHPKEVTWENIANMRRQIRSLGFSYDWSREVNTADPSYYKWTQWLFLKLYKKGLAYRKEAPVNWCPSCQTVLANEQVVDGSCERCHSKVEQRQMKQWFFKVTDYADRLLDELAELDWPKPIMDMQANWIGRSEGAAVKFQISNSRFQIKEIEIFTTRLDTIFGATFMVVSPELAKKWMDAGWQATDEVKQYVEKSLVGRELERMERAAKDKTGVDAGIKAMNPATHEEIPVWVADYVLGSYGTGAIMAVPAHDERDFEFAKKFGLPIKRVVEPKFVSTSGEEAFRARDKVIKRNAVCCVVRNPKDDTYLCVSWKAFKMHGFVTGGVEEGEDIVEAAKREIQEETGYKHVKLARDPHFALHSFFYHRVKQQNRHARFRYLFFELIDEARDPIDTKEESLHEILWKRPAELRDFFSVIEGEFTLNFLADPDYIHTGDGILWDSGEFTGLESDEAKRKIAKQIGAELKTQYRLRDWLISRQRYWGAPIPIIYCESCGEVPVPEKSLPVMLPDDVDFRPHGESPLARSRAFHDVNCPKCGAAARRESDTMDTFVDSSWYFLRYCDPKNETEAFDKKKVREWCPVNLYVGGAEHAVMHLLYARFFTKVLQDLKFVKFSEPFVKLRNQGLILGEDGQKMSKSRGNVINPDDIIKEHGADTLRLYEMFMGPLEDAKPWNTSSIIGIRRFLERVWYLCDRWKVRYDNRPKELQAFYDSKEGSGLLSGVFHATIKKVTDDIETMKFNTAIAALMNLLNKTIQFTDGGTTTVSITKGISISQCKDFLTLLYPFAPHITSELWKQLEFEGYVWEQAWPTYDKAALKQDKISVTVQVNGKVRSSVQVAAEATEAEVVAAAQADEKVARHLQGKRVVRMVYVPGRLVNLVVS